METKKPTDDKPSETPSQAPTETPKPPKPVLTWGEFQTFMRARGVMDDDPIEYIDIAPVVFADKADALVGSAVLSEARAHVFKVQYALKFLKGRRSAAGWVIED